MRFISTGVDGVFVAELEERTDARGFFAQMFASDEFAKRGLEQNFTQINNSLSTVAGTLRGLHYQIAPAGEAKLVRCVKGGVFDVAVDLRTNSSTFAKWVGVELTDQNRRMLYVPKGCAHGFLTLKDETEMIYLSSATYSPSHERIVRWNDPLFSIQWPMAPAAISDKDKLAADYNTKSDFSGY